MSVESLYQQKRMTAEEAIGQVRNGDFIIVPTAIAEPPSLLTALSDQRRRFRDVKVAQILAVRKFGYLDPETVENVRHVAFAVARPRLYDGGVGQGSGYRARSESERAVCLR